MYCTSLRSELSFIESYSQESAFYKNKRGEPPSTDLSFLSLFWSIVMPYPGDKCFIILPSCGRDCIDVPLKAKYSTVTYFHHFDQYEYVQLLLIITKRKISCQALWDTPFYTGLRRQISASLRPVLNSETLF